MPGRSQRRYIRDNGEVHDVSERLCSCMRFEGTLPLKASSAPGAFHPEMLGNHRWLQTGNGRIERHYPVSELLNSSSAGKVHVHVAV